MGGNKRRRRRPRRPEEEEGGGSGGVLSSAVGGDGNADGNGDDDGVLVRVEPLARADGDVVIAPPPPSAWSVDFVKSVGRKKMTSSGCGVGVDTSSSSSVASSVGDVGLQLVRGTMDRVGRKKNKNRKRTRPEGGAAATTEEERARPTPVQLRLWPALLRSLESREEEGEGADEDRFSSLNVVGIAPTGTGKTMAYGIPVVSACVRALLLVSKRRTSTATATSSTTMVHGLVLVPTRELAAQVSREIGVVAKVANKYLAKCQSGTAPVVESIPIYGGVDADSQVDSLLGRNDAKGEGSSSRRSLVVAATPGRLLDLLKRGRPGEGENEEGGGGDDSDGGPATTATVADAFADLCTVVFDEADRMAVNAEVAGQVDEIVSVLRGVAVRGNKNSGGDDGDDAGDAGAVSCLVSATLPDGARDACERWVPRPRVVFKVDSVNVGETRRRANDAKNDVDAGGILDAAAKTGEVAGDGDGEEGVRAGDGPAGMTASAARDEDDDDEDGAREKKRRDDERRKRQNIDLASIPSNIVQTLHVCSAHKKPRKLILSLQRLYSKDHRKGKEDAPGGGGGGESSRFTANNRLCIVFFARIKTLKYASQFLAKEGLRCVDLHGGLNQSERERRLLEFKAGKTPILLATDVAARGLHVPNVNYVVNYDFPGSLDQYVHRCGRAGRKQALSGEVSQYPPTVYSFFTRELAVMADSVVELLKACDAWVDPNLLALTGEGEKNDEKEKKPAAAAEGSNKKSSRRKRRRKDGSTAETDGGVGREGGGGDDGEPDSDPFSFLGRSVLKRASHVSDAEDSDGDDEDDVSGT